MSFLLLLYDSIVSSAIETCKHVNVLLFYDPYSMLFKERIH